MRACDLTRVSTVKSACSLGESGVAADQDSIGWIDIDSSTDLVTGFIVMFNGSLSMMDGAPVTATPMTQFDFTEIEDQGFTILHVANPNDVPANVTFQLVGSDGTIRAITTHAPPIPPRSAVR